MSCFIPSLLYFIRLSTDSVYTNIFSVIQSVVQILMKSFLSLWSDPTGNITKGGIVSEKKNNYRWKMITLLYHATNPSHMVPSKHPSNPTLHARQPTPCELLTSQTALCVRHLYSLQFQKVFLLVCNTSLWHTLINTSGQWISAFFLTKCCPTLSAPRDLLHIQKIMPNTSD